MKRRAVRVADGVQGSSIRVADYLRLAISKCDPTQPDACLIARCRCGCEHVTGALNAKARLLFLLCVECRSDVLVLDLSPEIQETP